nr:UvrB/UvrC motif-containing protein [Pseudomonadota bacterium]
RGAFAGDTDLSRIPTQVDDVHVGKNLQTHLAELRKDMITAAENLEFEEAARLRDDVRRLEAVELVISENPLTRQAVVERTVDVALDKPQVRGRRRKR